MKFVVSFVVIAYNEARNISQTIDSITSLCGLGEYEIIVVNDGSLDKTADVVASKARVDSHIRLIDLQQNHGRGYARTAGVTAAKGELIAQVDSDIILSRDWFVRAREALGGHDAVGGVAVPDGDVAYIYQSCKLTPKPVRPTTTVTGNNGLYRRHVFDSIGFPVSLREGEDVALNHAAAQKGFSFSTVPDLLVEHNEHKTFSDSIKWLLVSGKGATRQLLSYKKVRTPDLATGVFFAALAMGIFLSVHGEFLGGVAAPILVLLGVSAQHIRTRFDTPISQWKSISQAVVINAILLLAYFVGRLFGLTWLVRSHSRTTGSQSSYDKEQLDLVRDSMGDQELRLDVANR